MNPLSGFALPDVIPRGPGILVYLAHHREMNFVIHPNPVQKDANDIVRAQFCAGSVDQNIR